MSKNYLLIFMLSLSSLMSRSQCTELFISEYIEGTSNNKAIEIYNPTTVTVPGGVYQIRIFANGSLTPTGTINITGTINPGSTYVVAHTSANASILAAANQTSGTLQHNGNDAIQLYRPLTSTSIDVIGVIGVDPGLGLGWTVSGTTNGTMDHTIVRLPAIQQPNLTWVGSCENEWAVFNVDISTGLGSHTMNACGATPVTADFTYADHCFGTSASFTGGAIGGDGNYTYAWDFGDGLGTSTLQAPTYTYTADGTYTVTLTVTDGASSSDVVTHTVNVFEKPSMSSSPNFTTGCAPLTTCFTTNVVGGGPNYTFAWTFGDANSSTSMSPCNTYLAGGNYNATVIATDQNGCKDTVSNSITVTASDNLDIYTQDTTICNDIFGYFLNAEPGGVWSGNNVTDSGNGDGFFSSGAITPGTYYAVYSTSSACPFKDSIEIQVFDYPLANFTFSNTLGTVNFTNTSTNSTTYAWDFDGLGTSSQTNPSYTFTSNGTFTVCLTAMNAAGCENIFCDDVTINGIGINEVTTVKMNVYPNPSNGNFTVESNSNIIKISVKNVIGQNVITKNVNSNNTIISLEDVNNGFYFIELETENGKAVKRIEIVK